MAFRAASNWNNLPNGNFSPEIFSKKAQLAFRKSSVCREICNSDYFGEIENEGDTVRIIKEPSITVKEYSRGTQITAQDLDDEEFTLVIDKANYYAFKIDDIEEKHAHNNWESLASDRAGYELRDTFDRDVLAYLTGYKLSSLAGVGDTTATSADASGTSPISTTNGQGLLSSMQLDRTDFSVQFGTTAASAGDAIPIGTNPTINTSNFTTPLRVINRMKRLLDRQNVPQEDRWLIVDPAFLEVLGDEGSKLMDHDFTSTGENLLRNGRIGKGMIYGFKLYSSNNLPSIGAGPESVSTAAQQTNYGVIVAGHKGSVACAEQINKSETYRSTDFFGDVVRGLHLYGRKVLRPEGLVTVRYNLGQ